jgi:hypothetical protein
MDTFYAPRIEKHSFSECSLPGIDVRADANISQFRQPRSISGRQFLLNLFLRNDIFFRVFDLLLLYSSSRLPAHMTRGRKVSPNNRANGADGPKRDKGPLSTALSLTTSNSERCSGRFHSISSDASSPCSPRSIVLSSSVRFSKTKFFGSLSAPPIFSPDQARVETRPETRYYHD